MLHRKVLILTKPMEIIPHTVDLLFSLSFSSTRKAHNNTRNIVGMSGLSRYGCGIYESLGLKNAGQFLVVPFLKHIPTEIVGTSGVSTDPDSTYFLSSQSSF